MNKFEIDNQGTNTFLVYTLKQNEKIDNLTYGMISNNKITGVVSFSLSQKNEDRYFKYNISSKINMKQYFGGAVNKKRFCGVFSSIATAILESEEYMLDTSKFVIDTEYIFCDVSSATAELICLPIMGESVPFDMSRFFKEIVFSTQFDQTENCDYVAKVISFLNSKSNFSLLEFKQILDSLLHNTAPASQPAQPMQQSTTPKTVPQSFVAPPINRTPVAQNSTPPITKTQTPTSNIPDLGTKKCVKCGSELKATAKFCTKCGKPQPIKENPAPAAFAVVNEKVAKKPLFGSKKGKKEQAPNSISFAIPGQPTPPPVKAPFSIPGQPTPPIKPPIQGSKVFSKQNTNESKPPVTPQPPFTQNAQSVANGNFGETTVLGGSNLGETTVLSSSEESVKIPKPYIVRLKNNEKVFIEKNIFKIGKEKNYVDFFLGDNTAISRSHADIINREGEYYIIDNNSTNHTYLDGIMIQSQHETKLSHGVKIKLANEEFEFKLF